MRSQKASNQKLVAAMKEWRKIEERSIRSIHAVSKKISNPLLKRIFQIISHDSNMHRIIQQFIIDSLEKKAVSLTPEELGGIWSTVEEHIKMERATILLGQRAKENTQNFIHQYLIQYILADERKHEALLERLENIKKHIYPYA